ncbi:uncharacterized protein TM35_000461090 [Trypanosoma theileri]|uniref:Leishmanolysin-like peptidase n=1 Tax=Trypanosoma theileri TaxID=67003 RepID=A0A1X0NJK6_9TRYP|nr:uncharacterized protein TM35_000461090 [Trypanosoma theileri]ORC84290.1 hypothetical protein TM35_000461090 [Trypanosoma theileri]
MRRLLCTALLLLCCAYGCIAAVVQPLPQKGKELSDGFIFFPDSRGEEDEERWFPLRIGVFPGGVNDVLNYCNGKKTPTPILGGLSFRESDYKRFCKEFRFTEEMGKLLVEKILPAAVKLHTDRLSVQRSPRKLLVPRLVHTVFFS